MKRYEKILNFRTTIRCKHWYWKYVKGEYNIESSSGPKKCFGMGTDGNSDLVRSWSQSNDKNQWGTWGILWCNVLITLRLVGDVKQVETTHLVITHVITWMRTVSWCFTISNSDYNSCSSFYSLNKVFTFLRTDFQSGDTVKISCYLVLIIGRNFKIVHNS